MTATHFFGENEVANFIKGKLDGNTQQFAATNVTFCLREKDDDTKRDNKKEETETCV